MFLIDFCYLINFIVLYYINFEHKNEQLFRISFILAAGPACLSMVAFQDKLVFHKLENLTNLAVHCMPVVILAHIRWVVIPSQATLPADERMFPMEIEI